MELQKTTGSKSFAKMSCLDTFDVITRFDNLYLYLFDLIIRKSDV